MTRLWLPQEKPAPEPEPAPLEFPVYDARLRLPKDDYRMKECVSLFSKLVRLNDGCRLGPDGDRERLRAILDLAYAITGMDYEVRT